ncbi:MAG TPA: alpha/beta fold hydrolase [Thermoanaerobaculia bacterium]|nr:alpha/beta fold hydrolase [Thermoanaerobaculia bacterium]
MRSRLFAMLCVLAVVLFPCGAWAEEGGFRCEELSFDVNLSPSDSTVYSVFGVLCSRGSIHQRTIQITLHGATYGHLYWDWLFQPETYSYVRRATAEGYGVLNLDRIGIGQSDRPPAADVTIAANGYVVHQIVQELRGGDLVVPSFGRISAEKVVLVGHSLGSVISIQEAATYGDVDGVVLTGVSHTVTPALNEIFAVLYPANLDPRFPGCPGWLSHHPAGHSRHFLLPAVPRPPGPRNRRGDQGDRHRCRARYGRARAVPVAGDPRPGARDRRRS